MLQSFCKLLLLLLANDFSHLDSWDDDPSAGLVRILTDSLLHTNVVFVCICVTNFV
jgi:hypothetical protein